MNQSREGQAKEIVSCEGSGCVDRRRRRLVDREWKRLEFLVDGPWNFARVERRRSSFKGYQKEEVKYQQRCFLIHFFPVRPFFGFFGSVSQP